MKISEFTNNFTKEKESTLSLLRIPLNFFAEDDKPKKDTPATSNNESNENSSTSSTPSKKRAITLDPNDKEGNITIDLGNIEFESKTPSKEITDTAKPSNSQSKDAPTEENSDESDSTDEANRNDLPVEESPKEISGSTNPSQPSQPANPPVPDNNHADQSETSSSPTPTPNESSDEKSVSGSTSPNPSQAPPSQKSSSAGASKGNDSPAGTSKEAKGSSSSSKPKGSDKKSGSDKKLRLRKPLDNLKKKFGGKSPLKKAKDAARERTKKLRERAKGKLADKVANNPAAAKALGAASKVGGTAAAAAKNAKDIKNAIQDGDTSKMHEAVGDMAVKAAGAAGNAVLPGAGTAIKAADKIVGKTAVGKKAKKAIGCCCCGGCVFGCVTVLSIILLPIIFIMSAFSWITNLFAKKDKSYFGTDISGMEVSEYDLTRIQEASKEYSMQQYTDDVMQLSYPSSFGSRLSKGLSIFFGSTTYDYPIQKMTEYYLTEHRYYSEEDAKDYNEKYEDLIKRGLVIEITKNSQTNQYDQTSFGMAFDIIRENYSPFKLKSPSSAPKRIKYINGEKKIYTTYNPKGIHSALFQDVLDSKKADEDGTTNKLKVRFDNQVNSKWFDEIYEMLDKKFNVYISEMNETRNISLYDLFIETSDSFNDTEYYANLVNNLLTHELIGDQAISYENNKLIEEYNKLVDKLASLELMTYMLAYQTYYARINNFIDSFDNYANIDMFKPETRDGQNFWAQFLTFSNVEHYLALSSLAEPSLTYEIAVISCSPSLTTLDISTIKKGNTRFIGIRKLQNWFATYEFNPEVTTTASGFTYVLNTPIVTSTQDQKYLFDKYNVYFGLYDYDDDLDPYSDEKTARNENAFFAMFETATGISMSMYEYDGVANEWHPKAPSYSLDKNGSQISLPFADDQRFAVSKAYNQLYSDDTVEQFGLSHRNHTGIDYGVPTGTTIQAIASGTAYTFPGNTGYGNYVKVVHDDGYTSIYGHGNGTFYVNNGSRVVSGQPIMQSGNSGNSTGPHLHLEVRTPQGSPMNPNSYMYQSA